MKLLVTKVHVHPCTKWLYNKINVVVSYMKMGEFMVIVNSGSPDSGSGGSSGGGELCFGWWSPCYGWLPWCGGSGRGSLSGGGGGRHCSGQGGGCGGGGGCGKWHCSSCWQGGSGCGSGQIG